MDDQYYLLIGKIAGIFGVKGAVKIFSYTEPRDNILNYPLWTLNRAGEKRSIKLLSGQLQGKTVVAMLEGIIDRDQAALLMGWDIFIERKQLPPAAEGEYYWADLQGMRVETCLGVNLGIVDYLMETGANDVLVVKGERERLIPFLRDQTIKRVDLSERLIVVDWDPEF